MIVKRIQMTGIEYSSFFNLLDPGSCDMFVLRIMPCKPNAEIYHFGGVQLMKSVLTYRRKNVDPISSHWHTKRIHTVIL